MTERDKPAELEGLLTPQEKGWIRHIRAKLLCDDMPCPVCDRPTWAQAQTLAMDYSERIWHQFRQNVGDKVAGELASYWPNFHQRVTLANAIIAEWKGATEGGA